MDLYAPRKFLTQHLEKLIADGVIRGVAQAEDFAEIMDGREAQHGFVYVTYDRGKKYSSQGKSSIKNTQVYTLILAWRNNRPERSGQGHGMDKAGEVQDAIEWHIHSTSMSGELHSASTGKPFLITDPPETFYRSGGWEFNPMSFQIDITRTRPVLK